MKTVDELLQEEFEAEEARKLTYSSYLDRITVYLITNGELPPVPSEAA